jgi:hypothetical protein
MNLATTGLLFITLAWLIQLLFSWKGNKAIHPLFIICYMIGVLAMVTADYLQTNVLSYYESLTFLAAGILLVRILTVKK